MKKTWKVPVTWEVYGTVEIQAETLEEALEIVKKNEDDIPLPTENYYVDGSFALSAEDVEEVKIIIGEKIKEA